MLMDSIDCCSTQLRYSIRGHFEQFFNFTLTTQHLGKGGLKARIEPGKVKGVKRNQPGDEECTISPPPPLYRSLYGRLIEMGIFPAKKVQTGVIASKGVKRVSIVRRLERLLDNGGSTCPSMV